MYKWAASWQIQQSGCTPSEDSDQPGHPPILTRVFAVPMNKDWVLSYPLSAQRRLWSDWADAQADLSLRWAHTHFVGFVTRRLKYNLYGPRQANLVLIAYASSEGSGEPAHSRSLARTFAARSYKQWVKRNHQTESQIPSPSEWLGMRSWNLSWRNARRHKFAWRGPYNKKGQDKINIKLI